MIRLALLTLIAATVGACTTWHRELLAPSLAPAEINSARVAMKNGGHFMLYGVRKTTDTLYGTIRWQRGPREPVALPVAQVDRLEVPHLDVGRTAGLVAGITVPVGLMTVLFATCSIACPPPVY